MPRHPRIYFEGGFYHVLNRGVEKRIIFTESSDYERFLDKLSKLQNELDFSVYCYALLPNHFHLNIQTYSTTLPKIMGRLLTSYGVYFNKKYHRVGPLFQDRYKSILIDKENYFLALSRYIHLNPVSAGLVTDPFDYEYSSFRELFGENKWNLLKSEARRMLLGDSEKSAAIYKQFVYDGINREDEVFSFLEGEKVKDVLGSEVFNTRSQRKYIKRKNKLRKGYRKLKGKSVKSRASAKSI